MLTELYFSDPLILIDINIRDQITQKAQYQAEYHTQFVPIPAYHMLTTEMETQLRDDIK